MTDDFKSVRIPYHELKSEFVRILLKVGFNTERAQRCADLFALNSLEGVNSHGINRFSLFIRNIREGFIKPEATPVLTGRTGSIEQWNGNLGPGPLNASFATERAMELSMENAIGIVALANTNHWMRGGTYGWQAAKKGFVFIGWTNTCQNMPAWGASDPRIGNNPIIIAVPFNDEAIVLDFAMSQYSYGKLDTYKKEGRDLPFAGGFNKEGKLTTLPVEILETWRVLPVGYWKGSGLSVMLDILATILSGGLSTHQIESCSSEHGISQIFITIDIKLLGNFPSINDSVNRIIEDLKKSVPVDSAEAVRFPGENIPKIRQENLRNGVPVNALIWSRLKSL